KPSFPPSRSTPASGRAPGPPPAIVLGPPPPPPSTSLGPTRARRPIPCRETAPEHTAPDPPLPSRQQRLALPECNCGTPPCGGTGSTRCTYGPNVGGACFHHRHHREPRHQQHEPGLPARGRRRALQRCAGR